MASRYPMLSDWMWDKLLENGEFRVIDIGAAFALFSRYWLGSRYINSLIISIHSDVSA